MNRIIALSSVLAIATSALLLGTAALYEAIVTKYTSAAMILLVPFIGLILITSTTISVMALSRCAGKNRWQALLPLVVLASALLLSIAMPSLCRGIIWRRNEARYAEVVNLIRTRRLPVDGGATLPGKFADLSYDGSVRAEGSGASACLFFVTSQDMKMYEAGYLYVPDGQSPSNSRGAQRTEVSPVKPHWYYVVYVYE